MSKALKDAVDELLRPLVKAMIDGGVTFPMLVDRLRTAYVDVALTHYGIDGKPPTYSRVSLLTGVHRKEIRRLADEDTAQTAKPSKISLSANVIAVWCSKPEYLDDQGHPLPLPRTAPQGEPSVEQLVASVSQDVKAWSLIEEWLRLGVAELDDDQVRLKTAGLVPNKGHDEKAYYFGRNLRDHIAAGAHNLAGLEPALFDRAVYYGRIGSEALEQLRQLCAQRGEDLLLEVNRHARQLAERDRANDEPSGRMTLGVYFFLEDKAATQPPDSTPDSES